MRTLKIFGIMLATGFGSVAAADHDLGCASNLHDHLVDTFIVWNGRTPQRGELLTKLAMMNFVIEHPLALLELETPFAEADVDRVGQALNQRHAHFGIPRRYAKTGAGPTPSAPRITPERLEQTLSHFYRQAVFLVIALNYLKRENDDATPAVVRMLWREMSITINRNGREVAGRRLTPDLRAYLNGPTYRDDQPYLAKIHRTVERALRDPTVLEAAKSYRVDSSTFGAKAPSGAALIGTFGSVLERGLERDLRELPARWRRQLLDLLLERDF